MTIVDAIRSASSPHAVFFLVTAYIESLRHFERSSGVPPQALALPIAGARDLAARARVLKRVLLRLESIVPASELGAVLYCAVERLAGFEPAAADEVLTRRVRNGIRHSALSV
jgi:hypothetical protein